MGLLGKRVNSEKVFTFLPSNSHEFEDQEIMICRFESLLERN